MRKRQKKNVWLKLILKFVLALILVLDVFLLLLNLKVFEIKNIKITPQWAKVYFPEDLQFNNIVFLKFKKAKIFSQTLQKNPEIKKIYVKFSFWKKNLNIKIETEKIIGEICSKECFYLTPEGRLFKTKFKYSPKLKILTSGFIAEETKLKKEILNAILTITKFLSTIPIEVSQIKILSNEDLKFIFKDGRFILIDPHKNLTEQVSKLEKIIGEFQDLQIKWIYLDLRIPGKVFYRE